MNVMKGNNEDLQMKMTKRMEMTGMTQRRNLCEKNKTKQNKQQQHKQEKKLNEQTIFKNTMHIN